MDFKCNKMLLSCILLVGLLLNSILGFNLTTLPTEAQAKVKYTKVKVLRVVDGDTLIVRYKKKSTRLRLIGVDAPESVHINPQKNTVWGKKASKFTKQRLNGKTIYLEFDKDKLDPYNRLLVYVYTKENGKYKLYNSTLVKKGYARAVYYSPNGKYKSQFKKLQKQAKKKKSGFWKDGYSFAFK